MISNLTLSKVLWTLTTAFTLVAALGGILVRDIYVGVFPPEFLPGALPQDMLTILVCIFLFILIAKTGKEDVKNQIVILGLIGSFFYLYGIFTIERVYNCLYLLYALVFASSFWTIVHTLSGFKSSNLPHVQLDKRMLLVTAISSMVIAIIFTILWTATLIPLMQGHDRIEYMYSIYILDLCFVMPAFFITAVMSLRRKPLGILTAPAIMILGFFVIFPLGLNELAKEFAGTPCNYGAMAMSFLFAAYMGVVGMMHVKMVKIGG